MCRDYVRKGYCRLGTMCKFGHGVDAMAVERPSYGGDAAVGNSNPASGHIAGAGGFRGGGYRGRGGMYPGAMGRGRGRGRGTWIRGRGRGRGGPDHSYYSEEHRAGGVGGPAAGSGESAVISLSQVPPALNTITLLNRHFSKYGPVVNINVRRADGSALIEFSDPRSARAALSSAEPVLNNRFIGVHRTPPAAGDGPAAAAEKQGGDSAAATADADADSGVAAGAASTESTDPASAAVDGTTVAGTAAGGGDAADAANASAASASVSAGPDTAAAPAKPAGKTAEDLKAEAEALEKQRREASEALAAKEQLLRKRLELEKRTLESLRSSSAPPEKIKALVGMLGATLTKIKECVRERQGEVKAKLPVAAVAAVMAGQKVPGGSGSGGGGSGGGSGGGGASSSAAGTGGGSGADGGGPVLRGPGHHPAGPAILKTPPPGRGPRGTPGTGTIDNRTRTVSVALPDGCAETADTVRDHFSKFGQVIGFALRDGIATVLYTTRRAAERAVSEAKWLKTHQLKVEFDESGAGGVVTPAQQKQKPQQQQQPAIRQPVGLEASPAKEGQTEGEGAESTTAEGEGAESKAEGAQEFNDASGAEQNVADDTADAAMTDDTSTANDAAVAPESETAPAAQEIQAEAE
jgi:RNA recognition motif-containing protein